MVVGGWKKRTLFGGAIEHFSKTWGKINKTISFIPPIESFCIERSTDIGSMSARTWTWFALYIIYWLKYKNKIK